jgi:hypothetical protein
MNIRCFLIEPAGVTKLSLRRYASAGCAAAPKRGYHNAQVPLFEVNERLETVDGFDRPVFRHDGPKTRDDVPSEYAWPTSCECGYVFREEDHWQVFSESIYRRSDNGETVTLRNAPPGAMWWLTWMEGMFHPQLGASPLCVMTPGGEWTVDQQASNCTMKDDHDQSRHHCWVAHGSVPDITVDKNGPTCAAGSGSIQAGSYHGFLRNGYLVD